MTTKRIQNAYYTVSDVARARAFYETALRLKLRFQDGTKWAQFDIEGSNFSLSSEEESAAGLSGGGVIVFEVESLEEIRDRVVTHGGHVLEERDLGAHGRTLTVTDLDNNMFQLFQRQRAQPAEIRRKPGTGTAFVHR